MRVDIRFVQICIVSHEFCKRKPQAGICNLAKNKQKKKTCINISTVVCTDNSSCKTSYVPSKSFIQSSS